MKRSVVLEEEVTRSKTEDEAQLYWRRRGKEKGSTIPKTSPQRLWRTPRFRPAAVHVVFKLEQRLADRIRNGDASGVDETDVLYAPTISELEMDVEGERGEARIGEREKRGKEMAGESKEYESTHKATHSLPKPNRSERTKRA